MRVARTLKGLAHGNTLVLRRLKVYFQRFPGKHGTDADRAVADAEYTLKVGGRVVDKGKTAADGSIELLLPAEQPAELSVFGTSYNLKIDNFLEKASETKGQQRRLLMLGYDVNAADGVWGERSDRAALGLQADEGLDPDGRVGSATQGKLKTAFGD
jgi:hypothetical protein